MTPTEEFARFLESTAESIAEWPAFRLYVPRLLSLAQRVRQPFNLAIVGRMKTGKSTLINSLIGQRLALSDVEEATATINWICYGQDAQTLQFLAHGKNGTIESLPLNRIRDFSGKSAETLARTRGTAFLQFFADHESLKRVQIVDTPGTGSAIESHEVVAQEFLDPAKIEASIAQGSKADAIIYVVAPIGRESDVKNLDVFEEGRIPGSGPYNSICVLHKWDALGDEDNIEPRELADQKAKILATQLSDKVAAVISVSAPIGLLAKTAPDAFFADLVGTLHALSKEELEKLLRISDRWDRDESRKCLRESFDLPWSSFTIVCRLLRSSPVGEIGKCRIMLLEYSRMEKLDDLLEVKFFSRLRIIKALSTLRQCGFVIQPLIHEMQTQLAEKRESRTILSTDITGRTSTGEGWIERQKAVLDREIESLDKVLGESDRQWMLKHAQLESLGNDLRLFDALDARANFLPEDDRAAVISTLNLLADGNGSQESDRSGLLSNSKLHEMVNRFRSLENTARSKDRELYSHLVTRMEQAIRHDI